MELDQLQASLMNYFRSESWVVQVFIIVFVTLLIDYLKKRVLKNFELQLQKTLTYWDDALVRAAQKPSTLFLWIIGLTFAADIVQKETHAFIFSAVDPIREIGVIVSITWFLVQFISEAEKNIIQKKIEHNEEFDQTTADAIAKLLRVSVVITAFLVMLQTLGYSISGVLAFGGIGGIAIGFAAKDLLANFFGGLMIYLDRPFSVGDWIRSPDRNIEGTVENIGWRLTRIRTFDKRPLYIPNSVFTNIAVENPSRMSNRRIYETVGIRYDDADKIKSVIADVKSMLEKHDEIDTSKTLIVNFNEFAPYSLNFFIYTFTRTTDWIKFHEVKQDVMLKILDIIEANGAQCAFPTSTIHIPEGIPGATK